MHTGKFIKKRREELGITRKDLARSLEISDEYLKKIENGSRHPSIGILAKLSTFLGVPLHQLKERSPTIEE